MDVGGQSVMILSVSQMLMLSVNNLGMRELEDMEVSKAWGMIIVLQK